MVALKERNRYLGKNKGELKCHPDIFGTQGVAGVSNTLPLLLGFGRPMLEGIQHIILKQLLIGDSNFHRLPSRTMLPIPG